MNETMPETIYVVSYEYAPGGLEILAVNKAQGVEYIRADIARKREMRLVESALLYGANYVSEYEVYEDELEVGYEGISEVYEDAGLKELE